MYHHRFIAVPIFASQGVPIHLGYHKRRRSVDSETLG